MSSDPQLAFKLMDAADEKQMMQEDAVKQSLAYESQGKITLSYRGIKTIYPRWLDKAGLSSKVVIEHTFCKLEKDAEEPNTWRWRAQAMIRTECPATESTPARYFETIGYGETPYWKEGYNAFGQRTAGSMAMRNALRSQIPEMLLEKELKGIIGTDRMQTLQSANVTENPPPAQRASQMPQQQQQAFPQQAAPAAPKPPLSQAEIAQKLATAKEKKNCDRCGTPLMYVMNTTKYNGNITSKMQWQNVSTGRAHWKPLGQDDRGLMQYDCNADTTAPAPPAAAAPPAPAAAPTPQKAKEPDRWCTCMNCNPNFQPNPTDGYCYCQNCSLPVYPDQMGRLLKEKGGAT